MGEIASVVSAAISGICAIAGFIAWIRAQRAAARAEAADADARRVAAEHARSAAEQAESLRSLVAQGEEAAGSAARSAAAVEEIASALAPPRLVVEWVSDAKFALRNTSPEPVTVKALRGAFFREPFAVPVTIPPGESIPGRALDVHRMPFPGELVLDVEGEDDPVVVPATGRPPKI